ncbi:hypothetical protein Dimus_018760 [Dionaea muscipula]
MNRRSDGKLITLFVEDIPESMDQYAMFKMFAKFGVVRDAYIPRKRSKTGKQFGFVRYECEVAAEVAIQKTSGLWLQDKELRVKIADYHRAQGQMSQRKVVGPISMQGGVAAQTVKYADPKPTLRFQKQQLNDKEPKVRFADFHKKQGHPWHRNGSNVTGSPGVVTGAKDQSGRVMGLQASNTVRAQPPRQGRPAVRQVEEDIAKCARVDIGKIKIITDCMETINHKMKLMVGTIPFVIRVTEEQAVFICNTDFRCGCSCHGREDEQIHFSEDTDEDDDEVRKEAERPLIDERIDSRSFIVQTPLESEVLGEGCGGGLLQRPGGEEPGEHAMIVNVVEAHLLAIQSHVQDDGMQEALECGRLQRNELDDGPDPLSSTGYCPDLDLQPAMQGMGNIRDIEPGVIKPMSSHFGPIFNPTGINLEVVLRDSLDNTHCQLLGGMSADACTGKSHHERWSNPAGAPVGLDRSQSPPSSANMTCTDGMDDAAAEQDSDGAVQAQFIGSDSTAKVNNRDDKPRKTERPRKKNVVVKAVAKEVEKSINTSQGAGRGRCRTGLDIEEASKVWNFGKQLRLVSSSSDVETVEKIAELLGTGGKGRKSHG